MNTNLAIINFIANNWIFILLIIALVAPIIPPEWMGYWKYKNNNPSEGKAKKVNLLRFILELFIDGIVQPFFLHAHTIFGFKNTITILIFAVISFDVFVRREISASVVTLVVISIIALYLEKLIETGKTIKIFGNGLFWERKD